MTLLGFVAIIASYLLMAFYCPSIQESAPRWVYLFLAISLFWYQTMDALDGKQARRTSSSSPLGELFDHGKFQQSQRSLKLHSHKYFFSLVNKNRL